MLVFLIVAFATLATSFLCSLLEASLYSLTLTKLEVMVAEGVIGARRFAKFRSEPDEPIAAILTVNTIAHTAGTAVLGYLASTTFGSRSGGEAAAAGHGAGGEIAVFTIVFTLAVLFLTEILPKSIGVRSGPGLVPVLVWPLQLMIWAVWPISWACRKMMRALSGGKGHEHLPTEEEILAMSSMAASGGQIDKSELRWVRNALQLDKVSAEDLMTPRPVVEWVPANLTVGEVRARSELPKASRLPVIEGDNLDRVVGMVFRRDLLEGDLDEALASKTMAELAVKIDIVPEKMKGPQLLATFLRRRRHLAAVIDEYGGFEGIVTLEDVIECLLGTEIVDEYDEHRDMQQVARVLARERMSEASGTQDPEEGSED